jgi:hypothetical protein
MIVPNETHCAHCHQAVVRWHSYWECRCTRVSQYADEPLPPQWQGQQEQERSPDEEAERSTRPVPDLTGGAL